MHALGNRNQEQDKQKEENNLDSSTLTHIHLQNQEKGEKLVDLKNWLMLKKCNSGIIIRKT